MAHEVSVVICSYSSERWADLEAAVDSVRLQSLPPAEIVVVVDHNSELIERVRRQMPDLTAVENCGVRGLSGARNAGIAASRGGIVAFLDDDAVAAREWLAELVQGFDDPRVAAVGGAVLPLWDGTMPQWFPAEFLWVVGCGYRGLPEATAPIRNPIGANMAIRRDVFRAIGRFREGIGRVGTLPVGCEETELCIRIRQHWPGSVVLYEPRAAVFHRVPATRASFRYFMSRCLSEGRSKAVVAKLVGTTDGLASERAYTYRTLPAGVIRGVGDVGFRRDLDGIARALAICVGFGATTAGYAQGKFVSKRGLGLPSSSRATGEDSLVPDFDLDLMQIREEANSMGRDNAWIEFDIHGRVAMRVAKEAPTAALLKDLFHPFVTSRQLDHHDLTITGKFTPIEGVSYGETEFQYTDHSLFINELGVQVLRNEDGFQLNGTRELLVSALPLVDRIAVTRGAAMVHAATVEYRGHGICMPAWGGTGKTSTIAKLLKQDGFAFMGDDWAFVTDDGQLLAYAKPMFIKPHHRPIYPHLFSGRRKPLVPVRFSRPLGKLTTRVHPIITQYPQLARATRRFSPEHMMVRPEQAFPEARHSNEAPLALAMFVERYDGSDVKLQERDTSWMVSRMIGNFHAEIARHSQLVITALGASGLVPIDETFGDKAAVLRAALEGKPAFLLQVPQSHSPDRASNAIVDELHRVLEHVGVSGRNGTGASLSGRAAALATKE